MSRKWRLPCHLSTGHACSYTFSAVKHFLMRLLVNCEIKMKSPSLRDMDVSPIPKSRISALYSSEFSLKIN